jgi:hypothetical protein
VVGYDMALRAWHANSINPVLGAYFGHTEFVTGVDVCPSNRARIVTCAWDQSIRITYPTHRLQSQY